ncbi:MAG: hypothetical protein QW035_02490 [Candidatus Anstonellales archaeon]
MKENGATCLKKKWEKPKIEGLYERKERIRKEIEKNEVLLEELNRSNLEWLKGGVEGWLSAELGKEANEVVAREIEKLGLLPLEKLALLHILNMLPEEKDSYFCCKDDDPTPYLNAAKELGISEFVEKGERNYFISPSALKEGVALLKSRIIGCEKTEEVGLEKIVEGLKKEMEAIDKLEGKAKEMERVNKILKKFGLEKALPERMEWAVKILGKEGVLCGAVDTENGILALAKIFRTYYGFGDYEESVNVSVYKDGKEAYESKAYVVKKASSTSKDEKHLFREIKIEEVGECHVSLCMKSASSEIKEKFRKIMDEEEKKRFLALYEKAKKEAIESERKPHAIMPNYIKYKFYKGLVLPKELCDGTLIPYDEPEIVDEHLDFVKGVGAFVLKAQIDHCAVMGRQFRWTAVVVESNRRVKEHFIDNAWEYELEKGKKVINQNAKDFLSK